MTHNKPRISVCLSNGQFSLFRNEHFFEQKSFEKFKELNPEFFWNRLVVTYVQKHEDEEETGDEDTSSQSSLPILTETDSESADYDDAPLRAPTRSLILLPPLVPLDDANLPFMQTFVANIFIFWNYVFQHQLCDTISHCRSYRHLQLLPMVSSSLFPAYYGRMGGPL